ncbi:NADP transhydrogenase subunit alpha [bacterium]|nr:NADP transhydrogenase subunit alpha [bacterium]
MKKVAVIGAGISGLTIANHLNKIAKVTVFEKSAGYGGRLATRYASPFTFYHGAQYFKATTSEFKSFLKPLIAKGIVKVWKACFHEIKESKVYKKYQWNNENPHYVGVPNMNSVGSYLAKNLDIHLNTTIKAIDRMTDSKIWQLTDNKGKNFQNFDWVIVAIPANQASQLLPSNIVFYQSLASCRMQSCFSLMLGFDNPLLLNFDAAYVDDPIISWVSLNHTKPNRSTAYSILINSTNNWADSHSGYDKNYLLTTLCKRFEIIFNCNTDHAIHRDIHFWRYANTSRKNSPLLLVDYDFQLASCGDWCFHGRVESAFLVAKNLAANIHSHL